MADIDTSSPADDAIVSAYPANERASRTALSSIINLEHSNTTGRHKIPRGSVAVRDAISEWEAGGLYINTDASPERLQHNAGTTETPDWKDSGGEFASGTKMAFFQATAPTGWTQDTAVNDQVLRVVDSTGGGDGGSWTISGVTVDEHALTTDEIPSHYHAISPNSKGMTSSGVNGGGKFSAGGDLAENINDFNSEAVGGGGSHTHGLTSDAVWRPAYIDVIVCEKD